MSKVSYLGVTRWRAQSLTNKIEITVPATDQESYYVLVTEYANGADTSLCGEYIFSVPGSSKVGDDSFYTVVALRTVGSFISQAHWSSKKIVIDFTENHYYRVVVNKIY